MSTGEHIRDLALGLPPEGRASLAKELIESLEPSESDDDVGEAWLDEIETRAEAYESGRISADDWQVSLQRARKRLREGRRA
jgi:putative addiction module component (TIGR02574 family)